MRLGQVPNKLLCRKGYWLAAIVFAITAALCAVTPAASAKRSTKKPAAVKQQSATRPASEVRRERQSVENDISDARRRLTDKEKSIEQQLDILSNIDSQIETQQHAIEELSQTIAETTQRIEQLRDSVVLMRREDSLLCHQIAEGLRKRHVEKSRVSPLAFVAGANTVSDARRRLFYLDIVQKAMQNKTRDLRDTRRQLEVLGNELDSVILHHEAAIKQLVTSKDILENRRTEASKIVTSLKSDTASLRSLLAAKKKRLQQLDDELNRVIASETSTPNPSSGQSGTSAPTRKDDALTGSFASNKGKLPFPVSGNYTITGTFGRSRHNSLSHVEVENSGIDISVTKGTKAHAVYGGTVSSVFFMDGYENIVIIRHGNYLTVYAGLVSLKVRKGSAVKTGQEIGTVATVDGKTVLHFEVRKERTKLNPLQWLRSSK